MVFGNLGNIGDMLKQAKQMQQNIKEIKDELAKENFTEERGGITVTVSGDMQVKEVKINPKLFQADKIAQLEERTQDAVNAALKTAKEFAAHKLRKLTGGISVPGLF